MGLVKYLYFLLVLYCTTDVLYSNVLTPCNIEDDSCVNTSVQAAIPKILAGFPELGVKSSDPLYIERIEGNVPDFLYYFFNSTTTGIKDCVVSNLKIDSKLTNLHYEMNCPSVKAEGEYEAAGALLSMPVEGNGHFIVTTGKYYFSVDATLQTTATDGKTYLNIYDIKIKSEALTPVKYEIDNLYNGQKDKAAAYLNSIHVNWKIVQEKVSGPYWQSVFDNIIQNVNAYLKTIALEDLKL